MTEDCGAGRILHPIPGLQWTEIRTAAVEFAAHGWPVLAGTYQLTEHSRWLGRAQAGGLEPVADGWTTAATTDPGVALEEWTRRPYSVLLACGNKVDALEVPATHGERCIEELRASGELGPIAVTPFGTWLLFVGSGEPLHPTLAVRPHTQLHSSGQWVALPPTTQGQLPYRWRMSPTAVSWSVPDCLSVQATILSMAERAPQPTIRLVGADTSS